MSLISCAVTVPIDNSSPVSASTLIEPTSEATSDTSESLILSDQPENTTDLLIPWVGKYVFNENTHTDIKRYKYEIEIFEKNGVYFAQFYVFGYLTMNEFLASVNGDENSIRFVFEEYTDYNLCEPYKKGDMLLAFENNQGTLFTYWGKMSPMLKENESDGKHFHKMTNTEEGLLVYENKEAQIREGTILINELDNNETGIFYLGMTRDELRSVLEDRDICYGAMESDTGDQCYLYDFDVFDDYFYIYVQHDIVHCIEIYGLTPHMIVTTQAGLKLGDRFDTMIQLYGENYTVYEIEDHRKLYEYKFGDHYFQVCFLFDVVHCWAITEHSGETGYFWYYPNNTIR